MSFLLIPLLLANTLFPLPHETAWALTTIKDPNLQLDHYNHCPMSKERAILVLRHVGVNEELIDPKWSYVNYNVNDFSEELRTNYENLKDAPKLIESNCLPSYELACEMISLNLKVGRYLDDIRWAFMDQTDIIDNIIKENDQYYRIWESIRSASKGYDITYRRMALRRIKSLTGLKNLNELYIIEAYPSKRFRVQPDLKGY